MTPQAFAQLFDHTLLKPDATTAQVATLCDEARVHHFAAVCVNPWHVRAAARRLEGCGVMPITVAGFPLGANLTATKVDETLRAVQDGALEIDMVINIGAMMSGDERAVREDIAAVVRAAGAAAPVKVIVETAFLDTARIETLTRWCIEAGAAFIKTSTGFASRGASVEDIQAMKRAAEKFSGEGRIKIKASGGIRTLAQAKAMVAAGADRVGASASVAILADFIANPT